MVKLIIKIFGGTVILTSPATLPAAAVLSAGVAVAGAAAYGLYKANTVSKKSTKKSLILD